MSRCRCCDKVLDDREMRARNKHTGMPDDFCYRCRAVSFGFHDYSDEDLELLDILGIDQSYLYG